MLSRRPLPFLFVSAIALACCSVDVVAGQSDSNYLLLFSSPSSGEVLYAGDTVTVQWSVTESVTGEIILYYIDEWGGNGGEIATVQAGQSGQAWTIPTSLPVSNMYKVVASAFLVNFFEEDVVNIGESAAFTILARSPPPVALSFAPSLSSSALPPLTSITVTSKASTNPVLSSVSSFPASPAQGEVAYVLAELNAGGGLASTRLLSTTAGSSAVGTFSLPTGLAVSNTSSFFIGIVPVSLLAASSTLNSLTSDAIAGELIKLQPYTPNVAVSFASGLSGKGLPFGSAASFSIELEIGQKSEKGAIVAIRSFSISSANTLVEKVADVASVNLTAGVPFSSHVTLNANSAQQTGAIVQLEVRSATGTTLAISSSAQVVASTSPLINGSRLGFVGYCAAQLGMCEIDSKKDGHLPVYTLCRKQEAMTITATCIDGSAYPSLPTTTACTKLENECIDFCMGGDAVVAVAAKRASVKGRESVERMTAQVGTGMLEAPGTKWVSGNASYLFECDFSALVTPVGMEGECLCPGGPLSAAAAVVLALLATAVIVALAVCLIWPKVRARREREAERKEQRRVQNQSLLSPSTRADQEESTFSGTATLEYGTAESTVRPHKQRRPQRRRGDEEGGQEMESLNNNL